MKKISLLFLALFSITCIMILPNKAQALTYKPGDILVTNSTSSHGISGHIGIVIGKNTVLHTSGWKSEPYPEVIKIKKTTANSKEKAWFSRYPKTKVVRPKSEKLGKQAANNAIKYFKGKKIPYSISPGVTNIKKTYCSELVWYAYYKSGKSFNKSTTIVKEFYTKKYWSQPTIIKPYDFLIKSYVDHNGFKIVDNKW